MTYTPTTNSLFTSRLAYHLTSPLTTGSLGHQQHARLTHPRTHPPTYPYPDLARAHCGDADLRAPRAKGLQGRERQAQESASTLGGRQAHDAPPLSGSNALDAPLPNGRSPLLHCPHPHPRCFTLPTGQGRGAATGAGAKEQSARYHVRHAHGKPLGHQPCATSLRSMHAAHARTAREEGLGGPPDLYAVGGSR